MWYAPIGSTEYTNLLHKDILIKRFILSEQRFKQQKAILLSKKGRLNVKNKKTESVKKGSPSVNDIDIRKNRIKGCAVDVIIKRSFRKTVLDVITYDSMSMLIKK